MYFQFMIEDESSRVLVELLMNKICKENPHIASDYKSFRGIGGFTPKNTVKETKTGKLLNDLATYMAGFNRSLQGFEAALFIVLDNDDHDPVAFRAELEAIARCREISIDHVFCLVIEEMEAWLLGDENALLQAYPNAKLSALHSYRQDSICGTWETLADVVYKGGRAKFRKDNPSYQSQGAVKASWANNIGQYMDVHKNTSPSFCFFISEIEKRMNVSA